MLTGWILDPYSYSRPDSRLHNMIPNSMSVADSDPHGSVTFSWIRNYCSGSGSTKKREINKYFICILLEIAAIWGFWKRQNKHHVLRMSKKSVSCLFFCRSLNVTQSGVFASLYLSYYFLIIPKCDYLFVFSFLFVCVR